MGTIHAMNCTCSHCEVHHPALKPMSRVFIAGIAAALCWVPIILIMI